MAGYRKSYDIPTVADYSHWNEDARMMWYNENKYDMMYGTEDDYDDDPYTPDNDYDEGEWDEDEDIELSEDEAIALDLFNPFED